MRDPFTVRLFLDFEQDARVSMEVYGLSLARALRENAPEGARIETCRPRYPGGRAVANPWLDRYARYFSYPLQARRAKEDLNHIIDHGYAHLLCTLPREKTVVTVHDLTPIAAHRGKIPGVRPRRPVLSEISAAFLNRSRCLIAVSQRTKSDLIELCGTPENLVRVVPQGLSPEFRQLETSKAALRESLGIDAMDAFLILIGGRYFYKNHETSLAAVKALRGRSARECKVFWLGNRAAAADARVVASGLDQAVIGIESVTTQRLVEIYNACDCLLFPSLYEGFGWPPLEAMACGTPVVCSNAGSLPEVVGDAALLTTPRDVDGFVERLEVVMNDCHQRDRLIRKGLERARLFSWDRHAAAVWQIYQEIL